jgi:hypothetical protein
MGLFDLKKVLLPSVCWRKANAEIVPGYRVKMDLRLPLSRIGSVPFLCFKALELTKDLPVVLVHQYSDQIFEHILVRLHLLHCRLDSLTSNWVVNLLLVNSTRGCPRSRTGL